MRSQPLDHRYHKGRRLSGTGTRHADDILPVEHQGYRLALDRGRHRETLSIDSLKKIRIEAYPELAVVE